MSEDKVCALYLAWWPIVHEVGSSATSQLKTLIASITEKRDTPKIGNPTKEEFCLLFPFQVGVCCVYLGPVPVCLLQHFLAVGQGA